MVKGTIVFIDSNVEDTAINIDAAHTELVKYFHNISKNRWLMIKVFGVLMQFSFSSTLPLLLSCIRG
ncbi:hypothetical protein ANCDUO_08694 [Ancylostoma duodenale]|uniref:t-SNARE coiled-coil homology domain-containing protein n=1 Tax=Ancylostoma duodenale TaxID=51022 RepID=A0A0C2GV75_9BILA|nr:hypothetical protein ANCDUO_08694 [Ancylostoma duodenale]